ncbi:MAG: hypothetical protein ACKO8G_08360 [Actinomycetota bacterium]
MESRPLREWNERRRDDIIPVPARGAPWRWEITEFALSYDGYVRFGPFGLLSACANAALERWRVDRTVPATLHELRSFLFFEQRRWRHLEQGPAWFGVEPRTEPTDDDREYIEALLDRIRVLSGGRLRGPPDPPL